MNKDILNEPFQFFFSGCEPDIYYQITTKETDTILLTYMYAQKKGKKFMEERLANTPNAKIFVDSGAHTFLADEETYRDKPIEYFEEYLKGYIKFAKENKDHIFAIVELDIAKIVGHEKVAEWRRDVFEKLTREEGIQVVYVWHIEDGDKEWERMCKRYPYIGVTFLEGIEASKILTNMFSVAKKYGTRIHGFGISGHQSLMQYPFFSCDSSSVTGDSLISFTENNIKHLMTIEDAFNYFAKNNEKEIPRERPFEEVIYLNNCTTPTVNNENKIVEGKLYGIVKHKVKKKIIKFFTEGGNTLECTNDHSIISMDKEGNLIEIRADLLQQGDFLLYCPEKFEQKEIVKEYSGQVLDDSLLEILGLWVGDGYISKDGYTIGFSKYHIFKYLYENFAKRLNRKLTVKSNNLDCSISNSSFIKWMHQVGFAGKANSKEIPTFIYNLSEQQKCAFLRGYFSADGSASGNSISYCTTSKKLHKEIKNILESLGCYVTTSMIKKTKKVIKDNLCSCQEKYVSTIKDKNSIKIFKNKIGFLQEKQLQRLANILNVNDGRGSKTNGVPISLSLDGKISYSQRNYNIDNLKKGIFRANRELNSEHFSPKVLGFEGKFLKVLKIEVKTEQEVIVYDLAVEDYEKFMANNFLVHNTWLTGSQFGELNWFDGKKMFRLKKSEWKKLYKTKIIRMGGNWNLLEREDPYEMIRLNVLTFIKFRDYVRKRLANKAYWIGMPIVSPPKDSPKEENYNPLDNIPLKDWFEGDMEDVLDVAETLRIDTRLTKDEVVKYIKGYYAFCNEDVEPEDWVSHEDMYDFLDAFGDTEVNTITKAKKVLKTYFMENLKGIRDDLADLKKKTGVELIGKEREEYIEDPAYTKVEVPLKEVEEAIKLLSPPEDSNSMPEVDAYNEELAKNGLELIKEDGKPLKAYRKVRKSRKLLSKAVPGLTCDVCYKGQDCPMYKEGYVCAFDKEFKKFDCRDVVDVQDAMYGMLNASLERMQRAMFFEKQDGGVPDPVVTDLIERNMKYLSKLQDLAAYGKQIHVERKTITEDGKVETTETIKANPQQGGLLSQLFGGMENTRASVNEARKEMDKETIDL